MFNDIFLPELFGTALLLLLGCGVVANVALTGTKGNAGGFLMVNFGWGIAVFAGVYVAIESGAHLNPAVTLGLVAGGDSGLGGGEVLTYIAAQLIGAFLGAVLAWAAYKQHFDATADPGAQLAVFSTAPEIRNPAWNLVTEILGTFVLVFVVISFASTAGTPSDLGPLSVALLVVGIGASLGGPTGYAINPARDLGPRIAHAVLPMRGKGSSDWGYSWVPIVGPIVGGVLAGLVARLVDFL